MLLLSLALGAALGADRHRSAPTIDLPPDQPRSARSQPMPADGPVPAGQDVPPDLPQGPGPRATSDGKLFDTVAVAGPADDRLEAGATSIAVDVSGLQTGRFVELTALDSGHTILALVAGSDAAGGAVLLSPAAFQELGIAPGAGVRVRAATPTPQDQNALRSGRPASPRIDAPEVLLKALRKRVPQYAAAPRPYDAPPSRAARSLRPGTRYEPPEPPVARASHPQPRDAAPRSGYVVQVAALSAAGRASALAQSLGGRSIASGGLYRVQIGPFADLAGANRARDEAVRHGYRDAHVYHTE